MGGARCSVHVRPPIPPTTAHPTASQPPTPRRELLALRISSSNVSDAPAVADWPSAPPAAHGIIQLEGGRCGSETGAWLLSEAALFFVSVPAMTDKPRSTDEFRAAAMPSFHHVELSPPSSNLMLRQLAVSETSGALLAVVGQDHDGGWQLAWVDCPSPAACKVTAREAFPHGAVKDLTVGGGSLFIATAAALYRADTTLRKLEPAPIMRGIMRSVEAEGERLAVATELEMAYSEDGGKSFLPHMGRYPVVGTLLDGPAQDSEGSNGRIVLTVAATLTANN